MGVGVKVVTAEQMQNIDRRTIEEYGIPGLDLMERAGLGVFRAIEKVLGELTGKRVVIFCGRGNNGGDGFVVARYLFRRGAWVEIYLLGEREQVKGDAQVNLDRVLNLGLEVKSITGGKQLPRSLEADLIVDAIFGTGIRGAVRGLAAEVIEVINQAGAPVVAVDIPSGLNTDAGAVEGPCVQAQVTATMALPKRGLLLSPGREQAGRVEVVDIGVPPEAIAAEGIQVELLEESDMASLLPARPPHAHKGDFGRVVVIAGSVGMTGAAALTCQAVMRSGAGMAILGLPESLNDLMEVKLTEVMTRPLPETEERTLSLRAESPIWELLEWADVLAIGPGLSRHPETKTLVKRVLSRVELPTVVDADGLNALADDVGMLAKVKADMVLTPHPGELSRLIGRSAQEIDSLRVEVAQEAAQGLGVVLVLKGSPTVIATPDGAAFISPTGNAGMATAGSGDVLTGAIAGLMAQGLNVLDAVRLGVFLHGLAGDLVAERRGQWGLIAGDLVEALPEAMVRLSGTQGMHTCGTVYK